MPYAAALSVAGESRRALEEALQQINDADKGAFAPAGSAGSQVDLAMLFLSPHHREAAASLVQSLRENLQPGCLLGCTGETIIANEMEKEQGPALALWVGKFPEILRLTPFHLAVEQTSEGMSLLGWPDELFAADPRQSWILALPDPFTFPVDAFLQEINEQKPGLRVVGGMASAGRQPGENALILNHQVLDHGAACLLFQGPMKVRSVVSQGCRPIGKPLVVTKAQENIIVELGGKPPLAQLQELWEHLDPLDRELVQQGLHVGRVINEYQESFQRGDFLIRNVVGLDRGSGAMAITDLVRVGQTVQFHVRDAQTADEDLHTLLKMDVQRHGKTSAGGWLFSCNGRGTRLFSAPHHDARAIRQEVGPIPLAGFFAQGELGPIGGQNFIHGFTASLVLFDD